MDGEAAMKPPIGVVGLLMIAFMLTFGLVMLTRFGGEVENNPATSELIAEDCSVEITSLHPGDSVGWRETVSGTALVPDGAYVWTLERDRQRNRWYLHGETARPVSGGSWSVEMQFGREQDVPRETYVAAAVVGQAANDWLERQFVEKRWRSIAFPDTVVGCPIDIVAVRRDK
jgi:hypothetical protein